MGTEGKRNKPCTNLCRRAPARAFIFFVPVGVLEDLISYSTVVRDRSTSTYRQTLYSVPAQGNDRKDGGMPQNCGFQFRP